MATAKLKKVGMLIKAAMLVTMIKQKTCFDSLEN